MSDTAKEIQELSAEDRELLTNMEVLENMEVAKNLDEIENLESESEEQK